MAADSPAPDAAADPDDDRPSRGQVAARAGVVVVILGIIVMWIYVLTARPEVPGHIQDASFAPAAEKICATALARVNALPKAPETPDPAARAKVVAEATTILTAMVDDLERIVPAAEPDHGRASQWITDWRTYLQDRRNYSDELPANPQLRFYVTQRPEDGVQITAGMDRFAEPPVNNMPSCATPGDLG